MTGIGDFLRLGIEWLAALIPCTIVNPWEQGVRITFGRLSKNLDPGLRWYWPIIGEVRAVDNTWDVMETAHQTHTLYDQTITYTLGCRWRISDLRLMLIHLYDTDNAVENAICSYAGQAVEELALVADDDWDFLEEARVKLADMVKVHASELEEWGVTVDRVNLISASDVQVLRLLTD